MLILASEDVHVESYGGSKILTHFEGMVPLKSKYFIEGVTKPPSYIYILGRRLILYKMVYKQTTLGL